MTVKVRIVEIETESYPHDREFKCEACGRAVGNYVGAKVSATVVKNGKRREAVSTEREFLSCFDCVEAQFWKAFRAAIGNPIKP